MPSQSKSFPEIQKTNKNINKESETFDAVVVANYGDPGLEEDYHADVLSRYVVCVLESANRVLTVQKYLKNMVILVKRPEQLWIDYEGDFLNSPSTQRRRDAALNSNAGLAGAYTVDAIPKINYPYQLGERIKVKRTDPQDILYSKTPQDLIQSNYKGTWHIQGYNNIYKIPEEDLKNNLTKNTIVPISKINNSFSNYGIYFNKYQYEAMLLRIYDNPKIRELFLGESKAFDGFYYSGNGGYLFEAVLNTKLLNFNSIVFEDMNLGGKDRIPTNTCLPLVVTSPNSFTVPKVRSVGTVNYSPSYVPYST